MTNDLKHNPASADAAGVTGTTGIAPPPGCRVRGCCMGIPIGCGAFLLLLLALCGVFTTAARSVQDGHQGSPPAVPATGALHVAAAARDPKEPAQ